MTRSAENQQLTACDFFSTDYATAFVGLIERVKRMIGIPPTASWLQLEKLANPVLWQYRKLIHRTPMHSINFPRFRYHGAWLVRQKKLP
jgi:hypothetical protein